MVNFNLILWTKFVNSGYHLTYLVEAKKSWSEQISYETFLAEEDIAIYGSVRESLSFSYFI